MQGMRDLLRGSLGYSLSAMADLDKLSVAWTVACGKAMADRSEIVGYADGVLVVQVKDAAWLSQMMSMQGQLSRETGRIAGLPVRTIHFQKRA